MITIDYNLLILCVAGVFLIGYIVGEVVHNNSRDED